MSDAGNDVLTQMNYTETPYSDAEWEVIGSPPTEQTFTPVKIEVLKDASKVTDPLFSDYGGFSSQKGKQVRWHLPEDLAMLHTTDQKESAEERTMRMVEEHAAALEAMEKRSFEAGRKAGLEEAQTQAEQRIQALSQRMNEIANDLQRQVTEQCDTVERKAVSLAIDIAKQLTRSTVEYNPEYILPIIKEGLQQAGGATVQSVKVSKEDLEFLTLAGSLDGLDGATTKWQFVADDSIKSGCVIETSSGELDFQVEPAFERVKEQIMRAVR